MKQSVYDAPADRDFQSKIVSGTTYLDCLAGHSLNPDVQVKFDLKTLPLRSTAGYILDGTVHTQNPRYTSSDPDDNPWVDGFVTFCSFCVFGTIPLLGYACLYTLQLTATTLFGIAVALTATTLFLLGVLKAKFSKKTWYASGLEVLLLGGGTATVAFLVGIFVEKVALSGSAGAGNLF